MSENTRTNTRKNNVLLAKTQIEKLIQQLTIDVQKVSIQAAQIQIDISYLQKKLDAWHELLDEII